MFWLRNKKNNFLVCILNLMRAVRTEIGATKKEKCLVIRHDSMDPAQLHRLAGIVNV